MSVTLIPGSPADAVVTEAAVSDAERCARRTLAAAQRLLHPDQDPAPRSTVEIELARYVRETYRPRLSTWTQPLR
jgi:hypothetical protein